LATRGFDDASPLKWVLSPEGAEKIKQATGFMYLTEEQTNAEQQRVARSVYANGATDHPLRRSMSTACV